MTPLDLTLAAVLAHDWRVVLLQPRAKKPAGTHWTVTTDLDVIRRHVEVGGNIGLVCGPDSGVAVFDPDLPAEFDALEHDLGPLVRTVRTGSGNVHCYVRYEPDLPASLRYQGTIIGQIQRGPGQQQVVLPPSIHPTTGRAYAWLVDPRDPLPTLPEGWREYLRARPEAPTAAASPDAWDGPPAEELLRRAMQQPGASRRSTGVKFQCPGCCAEGHDEHKDNAFVRLDGRFGCAYDADHLADHRRAIADALDVSNVNATVADIFGVPLSWVRGY
jgi:Bifunctional DNA primase/polymerase, N-terminal